MHPGNLQAAAGRLQEALESLQIAWETTRDQWSDERSRGVEADYLQPLAEEVNAALPAILHMAQVLSQSARECSD